MKVAFIDDVHPIIAQKMQEKGWQCDYFLKYNRAALLRIIPDYDGLVLRSRIKIDQDFLSHATNLKFIGRPGAGLENIDTEYCKMHNIDVFRSPEGNRDAVAEHVLGMLLMLINNIKKGDTEVRNSIWLREENRGSELMKKTFAIIGYGYMGEAVAKRLQGFGMNVIAYDKYKTNYSSDIVKEASLEEVFESADFVSLHTPLTEETIGMINSNFINQFKKPIYFINTARGKSVVTKDLVQALQSKKVIGACLDVLEYEKSSFTNLNIEKLPEPMKYLINSNDVILTPHIAGWTHEAKEKMGTFLVDKILKKFA